MSRLAAVFALVLAACGTSRIPACRVDADCASGVCDKLTGTCAPPADAGATSDAGGSSVAGHDGGHVDAGSSGTGMPDAGSGEMSTNDAGMLSGTCLPNNDGIIDRSELPLQAGLSATFRVATNVTVDTAGKTTDGMTTWDFSGVLSGDQDVRVQLQPIDGQWFASYYPSATYAAQLSQSSDLLGIFQLTNDALLMVGVASPMNSLMETRLTYDPPVTVLKLPMKLGDQWQTVSSVTGLAQGIAVLYSETYTMNVDKSGSAITPYATFPVLRVNTTLDRLVGALATTTRSFSFVAECFSSVVSISSQTDETEPEFTDAAEIQRLAP